MNTSAHAGRGFSLVELMIAITLGLLLLAVMIAVWLGVRQSYTVQDALARMQENVRLALRLITHDIRMAGARGDAVQAWVLGESTDLPLGIVGGECHAGWARTLLPASDGGTAPALTGTDGMPGVFSGCITASEQIAGTDVLAIHFADATALPDSAIERGKAYLRSTLAGGLLFKAAADRALPGDFALAGTARNFRLLANVYYLRRWSVVAPSRANPAGDGIPTLMRASLGDCGAVLCVKKEALIEGIAALHFLYGSEDKSDIVYRDAGQLGDFTTMDGRAQWSQVRLVRIGLLARALNAEPAYVDPHAPYSFGDEQVVATAGYRQLWLTATAALRNTGM